MITGNFKDRLEGNLAAFYHDPDTDNSLNRACNYILLLLTPKLQWNVEEIRHHGGDILLSTIHTVNNYHTNIRIFQPVGGITYVAWNGHVIFEGTLEECKKYCSNKILEDFLKLCQ